MTWACPKCKSQHLTVLVMTAATLVQYNDQHFETEVDGDHEWDGSSLMTCIDCGYSDPARDFQEEQEDDDEQDDPV